MAGQRGCEKEKNVYNPKTYEYHSYLPIDGCSEVQRVQRSSEGCSEAQ
jgi:hypothetical protein